MVLEAIVRHTEALDDSAALPALLTAREIFDAKAALSPSSPTFGGDAQSDGGDSPTCVSLVCKQM